MIVRNYFLIIFALKPFIDQFLYVRFNLGPKEISPLDITGALTFFAALWGLYDYSIKKKVKVYNGKVIMIFLSIVTILGIANFYRDGNFLYFIEVIFRIATPYLIYFFFYYFLADEIYKKKLIKTVWFSHLSASILSIIFYAFSVGRFDISQGVKRFSGFYGDSMTLSQVAFIAVIFGILFYELMKKQRKLNFNIKFLYLLTLLVGAVIIAITITKMTIVVSFIFILAWWGIYKKRKIIVFPLAILALVYTFQESENIQKRFRHEIGVLEQFEKENEMTFYEARGVGSGRFGRWIIAYDLYMNKYDTIDKLFGTYRFYKVHNQYIGFLLHIGLVGVSVFLLLLFRFYYKLIKDYLHKKDFETYMALLFFSSIVIIGMGYMSFTYSGYLWLSFMLLSVINVNRVSVKSQVHEKRLVKVIKRNNKFIPVYGKR